ncbi:hypothetical protein ABMA27_016850 [Loxostege sticticalis]|uniref:Reverse transcriptase domain-containing protein n=1 Tax=Loxostege sticticalis TaxID=481309 RepID=A0ABR3I3U7_LOXSC
MYDNKFSHETTFDQFLPCNVDEISKIIDDLDSNTSTGLDGISTKAIKCLKNIIIDRLTNCINTCLTRGVFPDTLKVAKVTPIYKSGCKTDPSNYRPVSVLPFGFRSQSNTLAAAVDLITNIKINIDQKSLALGIFIDLKKARQVVKIDDFTSSSQNMYYGIAQGSIIGPLMFLIYINNINKIGLEGQLTLYADDTSAITNLMSLQRLQNKLIKVLFHYPYLTPTNKLYEKTGLLKIKQLYHYYTCILLIKPRTGYGRKTILFEGAQLYNKLPNNIKECDSIQMYKNTLKKHVKNSQNYSHFLIVFKTLLKYLFCKPRVSPLLININLDTVSVVCRTEPTDSSSSAQQISDSSRVAEEPAARCRRRHRAPVPSPAVIRFSYNLPIITIIFYFYTIPGKLMVTEILKCSRTHYFLSRVTN